MPSTFFHSSISIYVLSESIKTTHIFYKNIYLILYIYRIFFNIFYNNILYLLLTNILFFVIKKIDILILLYLGVIIILYVVQKLTVQIKFYFYYTEGTMNYTKKALALHKEWQGKINTTSKCEVKTRDDLALAYTPGVAEPCKVIAENKEYAYTYTIKSNTVLVVSDGSAVLGLGNIGPYAAMPVMEGKAVLFKEFGDVNAVPICLDTQDTDEIIKTVVNIAPGYGGINLEDISAPRCFEIENRLKELLDIPVFHDDQHGTAIVVLAAIINALKVTDKSKKAVRSL